MSGRPHDNYRRGVWLTVAAAVMFGAWPAATRGAYDNGCNSSFLLLLVMVARAAPLVIASFIQRQKLFQTREILHSSIVGGFLQAASTSLIVIAVSFMPGPLVVVLLFTHTLMLLLFMAWRGEIKLDLITLLTTISALAGLTLVLDLWHKQTSANLIGTGLTLIAAVMIMSRLYIYGQQTKKRHPVAVGAENFLTANLFMPLILLYQLPQPPATMAGYGWVVAACIFLSAGTFMQFYSIAWLGSFRFSLLLKMEPLFTTIFSALLVSEILKPSQYFGIVLVIGSLAIYQLIDHRRRSKNSLV